jgi:hypothetical protein
MPDVMETVDLVIEAYGTVTPPVTEDTPPVTEEDEDA